MLWKILVILYWKKVITVILITNFQKGETEQCERKGKKLSLSGAFILPKYESYLLLKASFLGTNYGNILGITNQSLVKKQLRIMIVLLNMRL